jgi:hypothetical protein
MRAILLGGLRGNVVWRKVNFRVECFLKCAAHWMHRRDPQGRTVKLGGWHLVDPEQVAQLSDRDRILIRRLAEIAD